MSVAGKERRTFFSTLDKEQCVSFLSERGVDIPTELANIDIQELVTSIEANPDKVYAVNWTVFYDFIEEVRAVVKDYYDLPISVNTINASRYVLQNSVLYSWDANTMPGYNCYAYVLGRSSRCDPGDFSNQTYNDSMSIASFAELVKADLNNGLGYSCVKIQNSYPSATSGWTNVIAARKDTNYDAGGINDYHFAKLNSSNWYHKPGGTAILKFINNPSNSIIWTDEAYAYGGYMEPIVWYDSDIVFMLYKENHGSITYTWTGEHYHAGANHYFLFANICSDCGDYLNTEWVSRSCSGPPCALPWSLRLE